MNLNSLDLNLLVALDALLRETNVSRAATRIGLSQPAASHALQRLRDLIGDPLLVRTGARMELTPRAQALRAPLAQALDQVRALFIPDNFDAASSERQFRLMMPDLAVELLMPPLDPGIDEQFMFYPTRAQMDPGSIWLRNIMLSIGREMERATRKATQ